MESDAFDGGTCELLDMPICKRFRREDADASRLRGRESSQVVVEFGEQVWAKPQRTKAWQRRVDLEARWIEATRVGIYPKTGEHQVVLADGRTLLRAHTVERRPVEERWNATAISDIEATSRKPDPNRVKGEKARRIVPSDLTA